MTAFPAILSAPSGVGKTAIAHGLLAARRDVGYSVSCTTRAPRPGEVEGRDYYFLTVSEFMARQQADEFAEWANVHGNLYGTLRSEVERVLGQGKHVLMDIDVQGAEQLRRTLPSAVQIFVLPPSAEVWLARLRARGTEDGTALATRLLSALVELRAVAEYQYVVVNDNLERAVASVSAILDSEGMRRERLHNLEQDVRAIVARLERELHPTQASPTL